MLRCGTRRGHGAALVYHFSRKLFIFKALIAWQEGGGVGSIRQRLANPADQPEFAAARRDEVGDLP